MRFLRSKVIPGIQKKVGPGVAVIRDHFGRIDSVELHISPDRLDGCLSLLSASVSRLLSCLLSSLILWQSDKERTGSQSLAKIFLIPGISFQYRIDLRPVAERASNMEIPSSSFTGEASVEASPVDLAESFVSIGCSSSSAAFSLRLGAAAVLSALVFADSLLVSFFLCFCLFETHTLLILLLLLQFQEYFYHDNREIAVSLLSWIVVLVKHKKELVRLPPIQHVTVHVIVLKCLCVRARERYKILRPSLC
jgi:hypothetical protein